MPIDPQAQAVLDYFARAIENGAPPMWEMDAPSARAGYKAGNAVRGAGEAVAEVENHEVPGPGGGIPIRIYRPGAGVRPALVFYHGGGFVIGDLDTHDIECRRIANRADAVVVSVDYRLAPEHPFPAATDDAWAVLRWIRDNAGRLNVDADRLAVGGDSAGGNLAAVTAIRARDEGLSLVHQLLVYPAVDISEGVDERYPSRMANDGLVLSTEMNAWFIGHYVGAAAIPDDARLAPINANLDGVAPATVIIAECDPLHDEGAAYAAALEAAGVDVELSDYAGQIHGFFNLGPVISAGSTAVDESADALAAAFGSR